MSERWRNFLRMLPHNLSMNLPGSEFRIGLIESAQDTTTGVHLQVVIKQPATEKRRIEEVDVSSSHPDFQRFFPLHMVSILMIHGDPHVMAIPLENLEAIADRSGEKPFGIDRALVEMDYRKRV